MEPQDKSNRPVWDLHPQEVGVLDTNADALGIPEADLMEAAGTALARQARKTAEQNPSALKQILVLCGPGNNGGDGFVAARVLAQQYGAQVEVLASAERQNGAVAQQFRQQCGECPKVRLTVWRQLSPAQRTEIEDAYRTQKITLVIDALLGAGARAEAGGWPAAPQGGIAEILRWILQLQDKHPIPVLACDIPSGLGSPLGIPADVTLTFHSLKIGMKNQAEVGILVTAPLPWPPETLDCGPGEIKRYPALNPAAHKGQRGRLLVIGGGPHHGAPILAAEAAVRTGSDLVHVVMPQATARRVSWPTHLLHEELPSSPDPKNGTERSIIVEQDLEYLCTLIQKHPFDAVLIGPGLGIAKTTQRTILQFILELAALKIPTVIDADGIRALPREWPGLAVGGLHGVITPHAMELKIWLGNLIPDTPQKSPDLYPSLAKVLEQTGAGQEPISPESRVIITTGPVDQISGVAGRYAECRGGNPRMATAGTGDLLAGTTASLMAQGMPPWPAARLACFLLRYAGSHSESCRRLGPGLVASDLPIILAESLTELLQKYN